MPDRPPLDPASFVLGGIWTQLDIVTETTSTNARLLSEQAPAGTVLVAEYQSAGRGRLDRTWTSPPRAGLILSAVVEPPVPVLSWAWLPLMVGVALVETLGAPATLKWPNDLLLRGRKAAGILVQVDGARAVLGVGLNVTTTAQELPNASATSLALEGRPTDRAAILVAFLAALSSRYEAWVGAGGDATACGLAGDYRTACSTIGAEVTVTSTGAPRSGTADAVDEQGRLVVDGVPVSAGDVEHVRPLR